MKAVKNVLGVLMAMVLMIACKNSVDFKKTSGGIPYKIFGNGKGDSIKPESIVKYHVIQKIGDSVLFSTYQRNFPEYTPIQIATGRTLEYSDIRGNLMEILAKARSGDSIYMVQSADSLIKKDSANRFGFKKGQQIVTTARVVQVFKTEGEARAQYQKDVDVAMQEQYKLADKQEKDNLDKYKKDTASQVQVAKDNKIIEDYLKANNIQAQKTAWGVYVQVIDPGQGPKPTVGKYANVKYKGSLLSGEVFDQGVYPVRVGTGGVIKGFDEGVRQLAKGGKARVFIPSLLAYGPAGSPPKIGPNSNLIFELEVLDITDTPPAQAQQHSPDDGHGHN
jgi:FKBP-type peptidyl-prolyl cis-trans isomerase FkpA